MLNVKLDSKYSIKSDSRNYILVERSAGKNADGEYTYSERSYTSTLEYMLKLYMELMIRKSNAESIQEVLEVVKRTEKRIEEILEGH